MSHVELADENDDMHSFFNKSVSAVQEHADHFEQEYARPALRTAQAFFDERPVVATFVAVFLFLSALPVTTFLGLSLFAVVSFTIIALTSTVILSATVVLTLLSLLIFSLLISLAASAFLTVTGIFIYSFACLLNLVRIHGSAGMTEWMDQMSEFVFGSFSQIMPQSSVEQRLSLTDEQKETEWSDTEEHVDQHDLQTPEQESPYSAQELSLGEKDILLGQSTL